MRLPRRFSWHMDAAAARWGCYPADIIDWSLRGDLEISTALPTTSTNRGEVSGVFVIPPEDFVRMFRRDGSGPKMAAVRRVRRPGPDEEWMRITEPPEGVHLEAADLFITTEEMERFEDIHGIGSRARNYQGSSAKWDWEGFYTAMIRRIHEHGLPERQGDLVDEMLAWFERRSDKGEAPDVSTIRKKVSGVWRELREAD